MLGKVKRFNKSKGFGFIETNDCEQDVFFYYDSLIMDGFKTIDEGADVEFDLVNGDRGPAAKNIKKI
ncbi:MAG: cold shock domain-containing protein [Erysipelotrichaceae bacterium]|nr:cold shock domain-containing protein [Erysipelotrichaceae bacterium]